jgi:hypothetical protein
LKEDRLQLKKGRSVRIVRFVFVRGLVMQVPVDISNFTRMGRIQDIRLFVRDQFSQ